MTVKKFRTIINHKDHRSSQVLHSFNVHNLRKHRANRYLGYSMSVLFFVILISIFSYIFINDTLDDVDLSPAVKIILTPQDVAEFSNP